MQHVSGRLRATLGILCGLLSLSSAAQSTPGENSGIKAALTGEWRNQYVRIRMHTYNNTDSSVSFEADTSNWEARLHIKPIRTHFLADGSYYSEYRDVKDSLVMRPSGTWSVRGDSLTMSQSTPQAAVYTLHVSIRHDIATFSGLIDFDGDGKRDDEYYGVQKKYR